MEGPAFFLQVPPGAAQGSRQDSGRLADTQTDTQTDRHPRARSPFRAHLGRRLSEQRSVVQTAGAVGPGRKVLHVGASSLSPKPLSTEPAFPPEGSGPGSPRRLLSGRASPTPGGPGGGRSGAGGQAAPPEPRSPPHPPQLPGEVKGNTFGRLPAGGTPAPGQRHFPKSQRRTGRPADRSPAHPHAASSAQTFGPRGKFSAENSGPAPAPPHHRLPRPPAAGEVKLAAEQSREPRGASRSAAGAGRPLGSPRAWHYLPRLSSRSGRRIPPRPRTDRPPLPGNPRPQAARTLKSPGRARDRGCRVHTRAGLGAEAGARAGGERAHGPGAALRAPLGPRGRDPAPLSQTDSARPGHVTAEAANRARPGDAWAAERWFWRCRLTPGGTAGSPAARFSASL